MVMPVSVGRVFGSRGVLSLLVGVLVVGVLLLIVLLLLVVLLLVVLLAGRVLRAVLLLLVGRGR